MITLDLQPSREARVRLDVHPTSASGRGFVVAVIEDGQNRFNIFGAIADEERFEQIVALLNESFEARRPARPAGYQTPAELAGDYLGAL